MDQDLPKKKAPLASHCDTPLTLNNVRKALLNPAPGQYINPNNACRKEWNMIKGKFFIGNLKNFDLSGIQKYLLSQFEVSHNELELLEFKQALIISERLFEIQVTDLINYLGLDTSKIPLTLLTENKKLKQLYMRKAFFEEAVIMTSSCSMESGSWWRRKGAKLVYFQSPGATFVASQNLFLINLNNESTLVSRDHLTLLSDLAAQRCNIYLQTLITNYEGYPDYPTLIEMEQMIDIGDSILERCGNEAYKLIYTLESSCVSRLAGNFEGGLWENSTYRETVYNDMLVIAEGLNVLDLLEKREKLLTKIFDRHVNALSQIYGLYRIWGHPTLEPLKGVIALKSKGTCPRFYMSHLSQAIANKFKEDFIIRHINRHKDWPDINVEELSPSNPIRVHYERKLHYPLHDRYYHRDDLTLIKFNKIFPVDPKFDLIEFIDDKSLSLGLPELIEEITNRKSIGTALSRSLLLHFLKSDISDPEEFLREIDLNGFPLWEMCVGVHEKEREGKLLARLFGLLTLIKRSYVVLTEKLIAEHIFPYFPEITMVDDELALEKKRLNFTTGKESTIFISIDFSKWNTNMREPDTSPFYEILDQMFGFTNCFGRTHEMFFNSWLYLIDGTYLPEVTDQGLKEDIGCWRHHLGGIEGLRQKGWTVWTIALIRLSAESFLFTLRIMGQGDNVMLALDFPDGTPDFQVVEQTKNFIAKLNDLLSKIGPPLKVEETWISRDLYLYGKYPIYKGAALTMSLKKSCRMFRSCNEDYPTIESSLSSLAANLFAAVASDNFTQHIFFTYLVELIGLFQCNLRKPYLQSKSIPELIKRQSSFQLRSGEGQSKTVRTPDVLKRDGLQSDSVLMGLAICPRTLGGYPIVLYASLLVKGFPDQVSYDIATLKIMRLKASTGLKLQIGTILNPYLSSDLNYELLIMNPEALNLEASPSPSEARRSTMIEFLKTTDRITQPYVIEFLQLADKREVEGLVEFLTSPVTLHPKVLNTFMQATPYYRAQQVIGKLQKTPTMARIYQKEGEKDIHRLLERSELTHMKSILRNIFNSSGRMDIDFMKSSAVHHASFLRDAGWRKNIVGVDSAPPHEVFGVELIHGSQDCREEFELDKGFITIRICATPAQCRDSLFPGPVFPYRGSVTKSKNESVASKIKTRTPSLLQRGLKVAELENWVFEKGSELSRLAERLVETLTDLPYELLTPDLDQVSGCYQHRLRTDRIDNGGTCSVLPNKSTHFQLDTSTLFYLNKGSKNKNFMFQPPLVMSLLILGEACLNNNLPLEGLQLIHLHIKDSRSIQDISDTPPDYRHTSGKIEFHQRRTSPYLYFPKEKILPYLTTSLRFPKSPSQEVKNSPVFDRFHSLFAYDSLHILDPWAWTSGQTPRLVSSGVSINWAMACDLKVYIQLLARLLIISLSNAERTVSVQNYLIICLTIIRNSPLESWCNLANLSFNSSYPGRILESCGLINPQGSEILTTESVATLLKTAVLSEISKLIEDPKTALTTIDSLWAPTNVPPSLHPLRVIKTLNSMSQYKFIPAWILKDIKEEVTKIQLGQENRTHSIGVHADFGMKHIVVGISAESLDYLCKVVDSTSGIQHELRGAHITLTYSQLRPEMVESFITTLPLIKTTERRGLTRNMTLKPKMEKRDYSMYANRPTPLPTSGSFKLLSILTAFDIRDFKAVACLADGGGGFTRAFCQMEEVDTVFFNTLVKPGDYIPQLSPIQNVPGVSDLPEWERKKLIGLDITNTFPSDITGAGYPEFIFSKLGVPFDIVTGDAESPSFFKEENILTLFRAYRDFCMVHHSKFGLFKLHLKSLEIIYQCIVIMKTYFLQVQIVRSLFSLRSNTEIYLVCQNPTSEIQPCSLKDLDNLQLDSHDQIELSRRLKNLFGPLNIISPRSNISLNARIYHRFLVRHIHVTDQRNQLKGVFPWLTNEMFNSHDPECSIVYPDTLSQWIKTVHRTRTFSLQSRTSKTRYEDFMTSELQLLTMSFIFLILHSIHENSWNHTIPSILNDGLLIWYKTRGKKWDFLLWIGDLPEPSKLNSTRCYPVSKMIGHTLIQKLCRFVGWGRILGLSKPKNSHTDNLLVAFKSSKAIKDGRYQDRPKNESLWKMINGRNEGPIRRWHEIPDFLLKQDKRIKQENILQSLEIETTLEDSDVDEP